MLKGWGESPGGGGGSGANNPESTSRDPRGRRGEKKRVGRKSPGRQNDFLGAHKNGLAERLFAGSWGVVCHLFCFGCFESTGVGLLDE